MRRLFRSNKAQRLGFLVILGCETVAFSDDFQFFGTEIDYWHEKTVKPLQDNKAPLTTNSEKPPETQESQEKFSWNKYLDPKQKEFFKEGDYTPPAPFIEVVRNPTDSNLKMWFAYIDKKNELTRRFQARMEEYLAKNSPQIEGTARDTLKARLASLQVTEPEAKRYRFRMYFDSHCPHCKKMFGTLSELQARGFYVEAKQIDSDPRGLEGLGIPTTRATPGELKEKDIQSVPVLLIGDLKTKQVYRLTGYQTKDTVLMALTNSLPDS